jgi:hypothetical protein
MGVYADVAQLVEHHLAKVGVAGSNPVVRSRNYLRKRRIAARSDVANSVPVMGTGDVNESIRIRRGAETA